MSISSTQVGTYTTQITLNGEQTPANFITALDAAIVNGGWAQYDVSNQYNRVYRSLNADGTTYKIVAVFIDPATLKISTTSYETWDPVGHTGTNQTWTFNRAGQMSFALSGCDVIVMASTRWLVLQTFIRGSASVWSGVFEVARELPEDTVAAGYPCWVWASSATIFSLSNNQSMCVSFPRTHAGLTGSAAAINTTLQTQYGRFGATANYGQALSAIASFGAYAWDQSKRIVQSLRPVVGATEIHGRIFGLKATANISGMYNRVSLPIDSNFGYSATGTNTEHWVLTANPSTIYSDLLASSTTYLPSGNVNSVSTTMPSSTGWSVRLMIFVNQWIYTSISTGVIKQDISGTSPGSSSFINGISTDCYGIVYDNYQYVYAAAANGVYRIDTLNNDAVTFLALTNGAGSLYWDGTALWVAPRLAVTNSPVIQINTSTFTVAQTINMPISTLLGCFCSDFQGNTYVLSNNWGIYKIAANGTVSTILAQGGTAYAQVGFYFNGDNFVAARFSVSSVSQFVYSITGTQLSGVIGVSAGTPTNAVPSMQMFKFGYYDVVSSIGGTTVTANFYADAGQAGLGSTGSGPSLSQYLYGIVCDGSRMAYIGATYTIFYYPNVNKLGDVGTGAYGRLLLVK